MSHFGTALCLLVALVLFGVGALVALSDRALLWVLLFVGLLVWVLPAAVNAVRAA